MFAQKANLLKAAAEPSTHSIQKAVFAEKRNSLQRAGCFQGSLGEIGDPIACL